MSTVLRNPVRTRAARPAAVPEAVAGGDVRHQAYVLLRIGFTALPIAMGIDKFFNATVSWPQYLADWVDNIVPGTAQQFMYAAGVIEIVAGLVVLIKPRIGSYLVAAWLAGIIVNLVTYGEWYDVALRDAGLLLGALALGRLAAAYDAPRGTRI